MTGTLLFRRRTPVLIVGGGIGGLATAVALARNGIQSTVLERAEEFGEVGAGIQLGPNAATALKRLGVLERLEGDAVFPERLLLMDALSEERIATLDLGPPFHRRFGHRYMVLHRGDLLAALLDAGRSSELVELCTGKEVVHIDRDRDTVSVDCLDGSRFTGQALVGADGLRSVVRRVITDDEPVSSEYVAFRGTIPINEVTAHVGFDSVVMWVGPELHFVQYPIRGGELFNQVAVFRSWRPPGQADGAELVERFDKTCDTVKRAVELMDYGRNWAMFDREPIGNWTDDRLTLLGDAAHPMLQYLAQGACQALEDGIVLADSVARSNSGIADAFRDYQQERIPRTTRVQRTARAWGDICHLGGAGRLVRNRLLGGRADDDFADVEWLYGMPDRVVT